MIFFSYNIIVIHRLIQVHTSTFLSIFFATFKIISSSVDSKVKMFQFVHCVAVGVLMAVATRNKYSKSKRLLRSSEMKRLKLERKNVKIVTTYISRYKIRWLHSTCKGEHHVNTFPCRKKNNKKVREEEAVVARLPRLQFDSPPAAHLQNREQVVR